MAVCNLFENVDKSNVPIHTLPIEIITRIINHLSLSDVLSLACVSKIWRCHYINQNIIWMNICEKMNVQRYDYTKCFDDMFRNNTESKGYIETTSVKLFGPFCTWWSVFNRYNMVLKNIKANDFSTIHVQRKTSNLTYCTDDYIITVNRYKNRRPIEATLLKCTPGPELKVRLRIHTFFKKLISIRDSTIKIIGNKKYLVFEIHSNLFIYAIRNDTFIQRSDVMISKPELNIEQNPEYLTKYLEANNNTKIAIDDEHLAVVLPNKNQLFIYDLANMRVYRELIYSQIPNTVQCLKYDSQRVMIGITFKIVMPNDIPPCQAIIYHLEKSNLPFRVSIFGPVTQFKTTAHLIGVENEAPETPFIARISNIYKVFWIDCDTFSIDSTRKFIYYNINSSIFKYDLSKSLSDNFEVTQKIAIDAIAMRFSLMPINDRFLILRSTIPNSYDIFDVKEHIIVRSLQLNSKYSLVHVGKLSIIFSNNYEFIVIGFY